MEIIRAHLHAWNQSLPRVPLPVDRLTLAKRRWRSVAANGQEFGFDLEHPLAENDVFFQTAQAYYQIEQQAEPLLEVALGSRPDAAQLGWSIGNLHFPIAVTGDTIHAPDDPAVRQVLERQGIGCRQISAVFRPLKGSHSHGPGSH